MNCADNALDGLGKHLYLRVIVIQMAGLQSSVRESHAPLMQINPMPVCSSINSLYGTNLAGASLAGKDSSEAS